MKDSGFLQGKNVLVTRGRQQAAELSQLIKQYGGSPIEIPLLSFLPSNNKNYIQPYLDKLEQYDWIIFTSKNGVDFFFYWLQVFGLEPRMPKIAVIGEKTKQALLNKGLQAEFIPSSYVAEVFVDELIPLLNETSRVLLPKGNLARNIICNRIITSGAHCDEIIIYENKMPEQSEKLLVDTLIKRKVDVATFTSSSTVENFMKVVKKHGLAGYVNDLTVACIGPIAKNTAEKLGLTVDVCPDEYTAKAMIKSLNQFERR